MEHLENPEKALSNLKKCLHPEGHMFLTRAINLAHENHRYLYSTLDQARKQVKNSELQIIHEFIFPSAFFHSKMKNGIKYSRKEIISV